MRALELRGDKGIDSIVYTTERPIPVPENDEILVQVKAVGLNPVDYQIAEARCCRYRERHRRFR